ncbi:hypothetical protein VTI74DRAFT_4054 [Chaetomium olivicolor]
MREDEMMAEVGLWVSSIPASARMGFQTGNRKQRSWEGGSCIGLLHFRREVDAFWKNPYRPSVSVPRRSSRLPPIRPSTTSLQSRSVTNAPLLPS